MPKPAPWQNDAACLGLPVDSFFGPDREPPRRRREREAAAVTVCGGCSVRSECLAHAMSRPEVYGVWGGATEAERAAARRSGQGAA